MIYSAIRSAVIDYAARGDITNAKVASFLPFAEERIFVGDPETPGLRTQEMMVGPVAQTINSALPSALLSLERVVAIVGGRDRELEYLPSAPVAPYEDVAGSPAWYTVRGRNLVVGPTFTETVQIIYYAQPASPSADADENAIMRLYPRVYLYSLLVEAAMWLKDAELLAQYLPLFRSAMQGAAFADQQSRRGNAPIRIVADGTVRP